MTPREEPRPVLEAQDYGPDVGPEPGSLEELLGVDIPPEIQRAFQQLLSSKEYALANLNAQKVRYLEIMLELMTLEYLFRLPPSMSYALCNMVGMRKASLDTTHFLGLMKMWFTAHVSRGYEGFERKQENTRITYGTMEQRLPLPPTNPGKPGMLARMFGLGRR